jgi:hypothetical protein
MNHLSLHILLRRLDARSLDPAPHRPQRLMLPLDYYYSALLPPPSSSEKGQCPSTVTRGEAGLRDREVGKERRRRGRSTETNSVQPRRAENVSAEKDDTAASRVMAVATVVESNMCLPHWAHVVSPVKTSFQLTGVNRTEKGGPL